MVVTVCRVRAPANGGEGLSIFGSAAERTETATVHWEFTRYDAAERDRSVRGELMSWGQVTISLQVWLSHVYLPLYPHIFEGVGLAVSVGGSKQFEVTTQLRSSISKSPLFNVKRPFFFYFTLKPMESQKGP